MRPIKLTMSAFGPYAEQTVVDFEKLGTNGLYLITGTTGAGKTTIFDAITYALYGTASGKNRKDSMFRSKYADVNTATFVELIFEYGGKRYTVRRNPSYFRPAKRGTGLTEEKSGAVLYCPDERVIDRASEVDKSLIGIMGIDRDQFLQIAMIAQGDFLKVLNASTDERKKIFRQIFKTERFERIQYHLSALYKQKKREREDAAKTVMHYISDIASCENDMISVDVEAAKDGRMPFADVIRLVERLLEQDNMLEKQLKTKIEETEKKLEVTNEKLGKAEELKKTQTALKSDEAVLLTLLPESENRKKAYEAEKNKTSVREKLKAEIAIADKDLAEYDALENCKISAKTLSDRIALSTASREKLMKLIKTESEQYEASKKEIEALSEAGAEKERLLAEKSKREEQLQFYKDLFKEISDYSAQLARLDAGQKKYLDSDRLASEKEAEYAFKKTAFLREQAGILAENLEDGMPCPVCGSTHHPEKAYKSDVAPTEAELNASEAKAKKYRKDAEDIHSKVVAFKAKTDNARENIEKKLVRLPGCNGVDSAAESCKQEMKSAEVSIKVFDEKIKAEEARMRRKSALSKLIDEYETRIEKYKADILECEKMISSDEGSKREMSVQLKKLSEKLRFAGKKEAEEHYKALSAKLKNMVAAFEASEKSYRESEAQILELESRIKTRKDTLKNAQAVDSDAEKANKDKYRSDSAELHKVHKNVLARISVNKNVAENIRINAAELEKLEEEEKLLSVLSKTANGDLSGKSKTDLETYVQMSYFDRILEKANTRLMVMSGGQYELRRHTEVDNFRSQVGLDLDVTDHYNGSVRSVKTLSGGESFKASLALALGLSDLIQSDSGGIRLDTMFVDEGFGSLDDESLRQAMKALTELTEGNRLVGIISHVDELKNRIDKQIVIKKDSSGSRLEIIC